MKKKVITLLTMVLVITILAGCSMQRASLIEKLTRKKHIRKLLVSWKQCILI